MGQLESIISADDDSLSSSKTFYCYSAGCLSVIAYLGNFTMQEMADLALILASAITGSLILFNSTWLMSDHPYCHQGKQNESKLRA
jgi:hypothetical protein